MNDQCKSEIHAIREECLAAVECVLVAVQSLRNELAELRRANAELGRLVHGALESTVVEDDNDGERSEA
jgi:hypothetical protein